MDHEQAETPGLPFGELFRDPHHLRGDLRLLRRAIREGWPIPEESRRVLLDRLGVGDELDLAEADALRLAVVEARMVHAGVPVASWSFVGLALRVFEGSRILSVEPRSKP